MLFWVNCDLYLINLSSHHWSVYQNLSSLYCLTPQNHTKYVEKYKTDQLKGVIKQKLYLTKKQFVFVPAYII